MFELIELVNNPTKQWSQLDSVSVNAKNVLVLCALCVCVCMRMCVCCICVCLCVTDKA